MGDVGEAVYIDWSAILDRSWQILRGISMNSTHHALLDLDCRGFLRFGKTYCCSLSSLLQWIPKRQEESQRITKEREGRSLQQQLVEKTASFRTRLFSLTGASSWMFVFATSGSTITAPSSLLIAPPFGTLETCAVFACFRVLSDWKASLVFRLRWHWTSLCFMSTIVSNPEPELLRRYSSVTETSASWGNEIMSSIDLLRTKSQFQIIR